MTNDNLAALDDLEFCDHCDDVLTFGEFARVGGGDYTNSVPLCNDCLHSLSEV